MSNPFSGIPGLGQVWGAISKVVDFVWSGVSDYILKPIFALMGITGETIRRTNLVTVKIMDTDLLERARKELILKKTKGNWDAKQYVMSFVDYGSAQLFQYYMNGEFDFDDKLPEVTLTAATENTDSIKEILETQIVGKAVELINVRLNELSEFDWVRWQLQELYSYDLQTNAVIIDGIHYFLLSYQYDPVRNKYKITLIPEFSYQYEIFDNTEMEQECLDDYGFPTPCPTPPPIIPPTPTEPGKCYDSDENEIPCPTECYDDNGELIECPEPEPEPVCYDDGGFEIPCPEPCFNVDDRVIPCPDGKCYKWGGDEIPCPPMVPCVNPNGFIVPCKDGNCYDSDGEVISCPTLPILENKIVELLPYSTTSQYYVVSYKVIETGKTRLWIYDWKSNEHTELSTGVNAVSGILTYPIATLKNDFYYINDYKDGDKSVAGQTVHRPPAITERRYKQTRALLDTVGVDVDELINSLQESGDSKYLQDAFFIVGISPSNNKPIISRTLWALFDWVDTKAPTILNKKDNISATFMEYPYNAAISWIPTLDKTKNEVIGPVGTYMHEFVKSCNVQALYKKMVKIEDGCNRGGGKEYYEYRSLDKTYLLGLPAPTCSKMKVMPSPASGCYNYNGCILPWFSSCNGNNRIPQERILGEVLEYCDETTGRCYGRKCRVGYRTICRREGGKDGGTICENIPYYEGCSNSIEMGYCGGPILEELSPLVIGYYEYPVTCYYYPFSAQLGWLGRRNSNEKTCYDNFDLVIKRQATPTTVEIKTISDLKYLTVIRHGGYSSAYELCGNSENFLIPLPEDITWSLSLMDRTELFPEALYLQLYSYQEQHLKWYQTTAFMDLMKFMAIVIAVYTMGQSGTLLGALSTLGAALALSVAFKLLMKSGLGGNLKIFIALVAMVAATYAGGGFDSNTFMDAVQLVDIGSKAMDMYTKDKMNTLQNQINQFTADFEKQSKELEEEQKKLNGNSIDAGFVVNLNKMEELSDVLNEGQVLSPSALREVMIAGYLDWDQLYYNPVDRFYDSLYHTGVQDLGD